MITKSITSAQFGASIKAPLRRTGLTTVFFKLGKPLFLLLLLPGLLPSAANARPVPGATITLNGGLAVNAFSSDSFTVTFTTAQTGLTASNFTVTGTVTGAFVSSVTGAGTSWTVTVSIPGSFQSGGTFTLNLANSTNLSPGLSGLPVAAPTVQVFAYPLDGTLSLSSSNANSGYAKTGDQINFTLQSAHYYVEQWGVNIAGQNASGGPNFNFVATGQVTLGSGTAQGPLAWSWNYTNQFNESDNSSGTSGIIFDSVSPTISIGSPSVTTINDGAGSVTYGVTYADANFNTSTLTTSNITLNTTGTATGTIGLTGSGTSYTVTISNISGAGALGISIAAGTASDYAGNLAPASGASTTFNVVNPATPTTTTILSNNNPSFTASPNNSVTFTATVTNFGSPVTQGTVSFTSNGIGISGGANRTLNGSGTATVNTNFTTAGAYTIQATYNGSTDFNPSSGSLTQQVNLHPTTVSSITTNSSSYSNASSIQYTVTFGASISGLSTNNFSLTTIGTVSGASIASVSPSSGSTYTVTVNTGTGDGTIGLNLDNATSLTPGISTSLPFTGGTTTIDKTPPAITALSTTFAGAGSGTALIGDEVTVSFSTSEDGQTPVVTISGQPAAITNLGSNNYQAKYNLQATDPPGNIPVTINLTDLAGNTAQSTSAAPFIFNNLPSITITGILQTPPTFSGTASAPTVLTLSVVNNTALAPATISESGSFEVSTSPAGPFSNLCTFSPATANSTQQIYVRLAATAPAGDLFGNIVLTLPGAPPISQTVSGTVLALLSAITPAASISNAPSVIFNVTFSDAVSNVSPANFSLFSYGVSLPSIASVSGSGQNYQVTVNTGSGDGVIGLDLVDPSGIHPALGNETFTGGTVTIDKTPPLVSNVSITSSNADPLHAYPGDVITVTYTLNEPGPAPVLSIGGKTVSASNTSGTDYTATATIQNDNIAGPLEITGDLPDNAGNIFHWDTTSPVIVSPAGPTSVTSVAITDAAINNLSTVHYHITLAGAITGLSTANFFIDTSSGSITGASVASVDYNGGNAYTVSVNTGQGDGPLSLDLANTGGLSTGVTNSLPMPVGTYTIDKTPPAITSFSFTSSNFNPAIAYPGDVVTFQYTTSEPVQNLPFDFGTANEFATGGPTNYTVSHVMTSSDIAGPVKFHTILTDYVNNGRDVTLTSPIVFSVVPPATLTGITLSGGALSPAFDAATGNYTASVSNATTAITVTPTATDAFATITVNGAAVPSGTTSASLPLAVGSNSIVIIVTAQDGVPTQTYTIKVTRLSNNASLASLTLSSGTLSPAFIAGKTNYTDTVSNATTAITIAPITSNPGAMVKINGITVASGGAPASIPLSITTNTINMVVTAPDGITTKTYTIKVTRLSANAYLTGLSVSNGALSPAFSTGTTNYKDTVSNTTTAITVTPTTGNPGATVKINGIATASGSAPASIPLSIGANTINILVTAQDGATIKTYTLKVTRTPGDAYLTGLNVSQGSLTPAFIVTKTNYKDTVSNATTAITVTPTTENSGATVKVNGITVASGHASASIPLLIATNAISVVVTAPDGVTTKTYTLKVTRTSENAYLTGLSVNHGTLSPVFITWKTAYTDAVSNGVNSITITPVTGNPGATVTVNSTTVISGTTSAPIALAVGTNTINIVVTAQDRTTTKTYTITITRAASGLNSLYLPGIDKQTPFVFSSNQKVEANNILSPNGDGINDIWVVKNIAFYPDNTVTVYNRAGEVVFTKKGYTNDWDGAYRGSKLSEGTYYYSVDLGNGKTVKGFITVVSR